MGKRLQVEHKGRTFWYDQQEERALVKFTEDKRKIVEGPMISAIRQWIARQDKDELYDAKLMQELMNYPESVREEFGVTTARHGKIADGSTESMLKKYPLSPDQAFKDRMLGKESDFKYDGKTFVGAPGIPGLKGPEYKWKLDPPERWPKPGELYACGKMEKPPAYKNQLSGIRGHVMISGTGGDFNQNSSDNDQFQKMWKEAGIAFLPKGNSAELPFKW